MSDALVIVLTAGLIGTACGLLGPFLILRRVALLGDAVSHAVLPGIVLVFLIAGTRAPLPVVVGAAAFAILCVLAIDALRGTGLVGADAAIALVFPALFALGVLGVQRWADDLHLDLDSTIYGEIAFAPFRTWDVLGVEVARSIVVLGFVVLFNLAFVLLLWKELKATSFDEGFARVAGLSPDWIARLLLVAVAITAVSAFESVGAILVVTLLIVPAATAYLLCDRLAEMVVVAVAVGWVAAVAGWVAADTLDASVGGGMGLAAGVAFATAWVVAPRHGLIARRRRQAIV